VATKSPPDNPILADSEAPLLLSVVPEVCRPREFPPALVTIVGMATPDMAAR
jgi:hypothetical protein